MKQSVVWNEIHDRCATIFTQISIVNIFKMFLEAVLDLTISILVAVHSPLGCGRLSVRSGEKCIYVHTYFGSCRRRNLGWNIFGTNLDKTFCISLCFMELRGGKWLSR